ncbi:Protein of unknown function [Bacillus mycoides]
MPLKQ